MKKQRWRMVRFCTLNRGELDYIIGREWRVVGADGGHDGKHHRIYVTSIRQPYKSHFEAPRDRYVPRRLP